MQIDYERDGFGTLSAPKRKCALCDAAIRSGDIVCKKHYPDLLRYRGQSWFEALVEHEKQEYRRAQQLYRAQFHKRRDYPGKLNRHSQFVAVHMQLLGASPAELHRLRRWFIRHQPTN